MKSNLIYSIKIASQRGMVLIVGLVMVLLITIIALAAIRGSSLQEAMAGNMRERNIALQAAESALRDCEARDLGVAKSVPPFPECKNEAGLCGDLDLSAATAITISDSYWKTKARPITDTLQDVDTQPTCLVEVLPVSDPQASAAAIGNAISRGASMRGGGPQFPYRVTAQGVGAAEAAPVVVQSTFTRLFQ